MFSYRQFMTTIFTAIQDYHITAMYARLAVIVSMNLAAGQPTQVMRNNSLN